MVGIVVSENEPIDRAIKRFKKKYERSGVLKEFKKRAYFTKPSVKKRMKKVKAIRRAQRTLRRTRLIERKTHRMVGFFFTRRSLGPASLCYSALPRRDLM